MKKVNTFCYTLLILLFCQTAAFAQSGSVNETLKIYFNDVKQTVVDTEDPETKRDLVNRSLNEMTALLERLETMNVPDNSREVIDLLKSDLNEMQDELNGRNGFDPVDDHELDDFVDYVQQSMEIAVNRTLTISVGTAILIALLLLLL